MKKTHQDRINLIDRLERKYARKLRLHLWQRQGEVKPALRQMRGRHFENEEMSFELIDGMLRPGSKITF